MTRTSTLTVTPAAHAARLTMTDGSTIATSHGSTELAQMIADVRVGIVRNGAGGTSRLIAVSLVGGGTVTLDLCILPPAPVGSFAAPPLWLMIPAILRTRWRAFRSPTKSRVETWSDRRSPPCSAGGAGERRATSPSKPTLRPPVHRSGPAKDPDQVTAVTA